MTAYVLISGQLFRAPEQRPSKAGKPFVTATRTARRRNGGDVPFVPARYRGGGDGVAVVKSHNPLRTALVAV
jgi:hypothetical protein